MKKTNEENKESKYNELKKLDKDSLIYLLSTIEKDIRTEYEKYKSAPPILYHEIKTLFMKKEIKKNKIPDEFLISDTIKQVLIHPVTLKIIFQPIDLDTIDVETDEDEEWIKTHNTWNSVIIENIKQVIAINIDGFNKDDRSGHVRGFPDNELICRYVPENRNVTLKDLTELIFRIKGSKFDLWYELFGGIETHIDENRTLYISVNFDHGS